MAANFPDGFLWGTATAAHQVEGGNTASDLWLMEMMPDSLFAEPSGDACDHYHLYPRDIALLKQPRLRRLSLLHRMGAHRAGRRLLLAEPRSTTTAA